MVRPMGQTPSSKLARTSRQGSAPGERRGGRAKGVPNKATASIREIARQYTTEAVEALVGVLRSPTEPAAARVAAANAILDRGYGKPSQPVTGDEDGNPLAIVHTIQLVAVAP